MEFNVNSEAFFAKIEPQLTRIAAKHRVQDPAGEARSWFYRANEILKGFETGRYEKSVRTPDGRLVAITETSNQTDLALFHEYLAKYLVKSFIHDIKKIKLYDKRLAIAPDEDMSGTSSPEDTYNIMLSEQIYLLELINIINIDIGKLNSLISSARDKINILFLEALRLYFEDIANKYGNIPIVRNYDAETAPEFFTVDIKEHRVSEVYNNLKCLLGIETHASVKILGDKILNSKANYALTQKIHRYLSKLPARLRKTH